MEGKGTRSKREGEPYPFALRFTTLIIPADGPEWTWLRAVAEQMTGTIVSVAQQPDWAATTVAELRPDAILIDASLLAKLGSDPLDPLAGLREGSPRSAILVVGGERHRALLAKLWRSGVAGCLWWNDLDPVTVHAALAAAAAGLRCATVSAPSGGPPIELAKSREATFTAHERAVLRGLESGLRPSEVAECESLSLRTVERAIHSMENKLGVTSLFALGVAVTEGRLPR